MSKLNWFELIFAIDLFLFISIYISLFISVYIS